MLNEKKIKKLQELINEKEQLKNIKEPIVLGDSTFSQTINKFPLTLVDFWAPWCGPCRMMSPIIDEIGKDYLGKLVVGKINVDEKMVEKEDNQFFSSFYAYDFDGIKIQFLYNKVNRHKKQTC